MRQKTFISIIFLGLIFSIKIKAQSPLSEILFVINSNGDSLVTSKILKNKTNEDQVTFIWEGKRKVYQASEVKSYFRKSRKVSIYVDSDNQHKLVKIVVRGKVKLAQSISSKGEEKLYALVNEQWTNLHPHSLNLKEFLSQLLPDFEKAVSVKKVYYDMPSLGKVFAQYNEYLDPNLKNVGFSLGYTERIKFGIFGSLGLSDINVDTYNSSNSSLKSSPTIMLGLSTQIQYNRFFIIMCQLGYSQSRWENVDWDIKLRTLNFTPLLSIHLFGQPNKFNLSTAIGLNFNLTAGTKILGPIVFTNDPEPLGLSGLQIGYDFQLNSSIGKHFDIFASYQIMPKQRSEKFGITSSNQFYRFNTNQFRLGVLFYFIQKMHNK